MFALLLLALPDALLNRSYSPDPTWERVSIRCAMPIPASRVVAGEFPRGLTLSPRGDISGVPTVPGVYSFTVELSDGCSRRLEQRQLRVMPAPMLLAEAAETDFHCPLGSPAFSAGIVRVSGSAPGRAYSVDIISNEANWLEASMAAGTLPAEGLALEADTLALRINPAKLAPGAYTARLRVSTWQGANTPELHFRLRVDSPQAILARVAPPPAPMPIEFRIVEAPSPLTVVPPRQPHVDPPYFPKYIPKPKPLPRPAGGAGRSVGRSRVLPFPKVIIKDVPAAAKPDAKKPESKKPEDKKTAENKPAEKKAAEKKEPEAKVAKAPEKPKAIEKPKAMEKKEAAPERTKPSAMPPPTAKGAKPAH
ncbi:MAG: putative Ig domain-containing protein [Bryobacterales bacterium]|nr:putative Ig domain-containing protein [Bryobacterales bacterium]